VQKLTPLFYVVGGLVAIPAFLHFCHAKLHRDCTVDYREDNVLPHFNPRKFAPQLLTTLYISKIYVNSHYFAPLPHLKFINRTIYIKRVFKFLITTALLIFKWILCWGGPRYVREFENKLHILM